MGVFGGDCPVCASKDQEIAFLRGQVTDLTKKLIEVASPGANARLAWTPPPPRERKENAIPPSHSPKRLAQTRSDRPSPLGPDDKPTPHALTAEQIEASFRIPS